MSGEELEPTTYVEGVSCEVKSILFSSRSTLVLLRQDKRGPAPEEN